MPKILVLSSHTKSLFWFRMDMMRAFAEHGFEVTAVGQEPAEIWSGEFSERGIKYRQLNVSRNGLNPFADLRTYRQIKSILQEERPDKMFCYQAKTVIYGCLAAGALGISEIYPLIAGLGSVFRGKGLKNALIRMVLKLEYGLALRKARRVMFQNNDDLSCFVDAGLVKPDKTTIINGSGVDTQFFVPEAYPEEMSFLLTARLLRDKGVMEYLDAARIVKGRHPEVKFLLVGPFDTNPSAIKEGELDAYVKDGIVEYLGELKDVRPALRRCSVFVLPSYHEGMPKTVLEAMSCGRPIITSDAPGCRETVQDGLNGFLVPVRSVEKLVEAMEKFIANPGVCAEMGLAGRKIAEDKYDVRKVNEDIMKCMQVIN